MATRSTIAVQLKDGTVRKVYCHWDGYLEHNGAILVDNYNTQELAELVTSAGDISFLDAKFVPDSEHSFDKPQEGVTILYGRDRGETGVDPIVYRDVADYQGRCQFEEYNYLFIGGEWYYQAYKRPVRKVAEELVQIENELNHE